MAAFDAATPLEAPPPRTRPRPAPPRPRTRSRPSEGRIAGGILWIGFVALLLTGVVAMNVAVLRLNMRLDQLARERADLRADNAELASQISSGSTLTRIQSLARTRLGLRPAEPAETGYVRLAR